MNFTGISPDVLLRYGAGLAAAVVVLYILKLKRRPVAVPFVNLWEKVLRDKEATSLFSQLKRLLSLLVQLVLLALMMLALGDPRPAVNEREGRHVVVLLDGSASMKAVDVDPSAAIVDDEPTLNAFEQLMRRLGGGEQQITRVVPKQGDKLTRLDVGRARVLEVIRGLGGSDRMLIAQMDAGVTPLSTMSEDTAELERALDRAEASDVRAPFARGLEFALDALEGLANPEIILVTDGALDDVEGLVDAAALDEVALSLIQVGDADENVAITQFSVRRYPLDKSRYEVQIEVTNTSEEKAAIDLELSAKSPEGKWELTDIVSLELTGHETSSRFYPNLSGADDALKASIRMRDGSRDHLPADDVAYALLPERRRAKIQVVTEGNMYLEAALLLDEYLDVTTVSPGAFPAKDGQGELIDFDVTIFDEVAPLATEEAGHRLYLNPGDDTHTPFGLGDTIKSSRRYALGFDEVLDKHPIMRNLSLGDINIAQARELKGEKGDKKVGQSFRGTLLLAGRRGGQKFVALGFDVRESDFPLRISWPLFVLNSINAFLDEDTDYISSYFTGDVWSIPVGETTKVAELILPDERRQRVPVKKGRAYFLGQQAGFYSLLTSSTTIDAPDEDKEEIRFAANLSNAAESEIAPEPKVTVLNKDLGAVEGFSIGVRREWWLYLLGAVLLITAVEWLTYHRRLTV
ncbi:MAG: VWA domain-containing protein [Myxococcota bacterium]